jgi:enoyl-[acyl-carrier protein] reductase II
VYFGGDLEAGIALTGQIAGRITEVKPVEEILWGTVRQFRERVEALERLR